MAAYVVRKNTGTKEEGVFYIEGPAGHDWTSDVTKAKMFASAAKAEVVREEMSNQGNASFTVFQIEIKLTPVSVKPVPVGKREDGWKPGMM